MNDAIGNLRLSARMFRKIQSLILIKKTRTSKDIWITKAITICESIFNFMVSAQSQRLERKVGICMHPESNEIVGVISFTECSDFTC